MSAFYIRTIVNGKNARATDDALCCEYNKILQSAKVRTIGFAEHEHKVHSIWIEHTYNGTIEISTIAIQSLLIIVKDKFNVLVCS